MKSKMNVIVVNDFDYIQGGASKIALDTARILYENNVDITFFSATHKENDYKFKQVSTNQNECFNDGIMGIINGLYNIKANIKFKELLSKYDSANTIIHVHTWTKSLSSVIFKVATKKGFKVVITIHDYFTICPNGGFFNYKKNKICNKKPLSLNCLFCNCDSRNYLIKIYRFIRQLIYKAHLKKINYYISISDFSVDKIKSYLPKNSIIKKINNPISLQKEKRININNNKCYIYVGRVSKEKGVDVFCESLTRLNKKGIVVGDGSEKKRLEKMYPNINFVGWKNSNEVKYLMKKSKALIFPSLWYEGAPLTILEALSIGLPCIVSNSCAGIEFIKNSYNGFLFETNSVESLIEEINKFEKSDIDKISKFAYKNYDRNLFSEKKYFDKLISYYKKILNDRR